MNLFGLLLLASGQSPLGSMSFFDFETNASYSSRPCCSQQLRRQTRQRHSTPVSSWFWFETRVSEPTSSLFPSILPTPPLQSLFLLLVTPLSVLIFFFPRRQKIIKTKRAKRMKFWIQIKKLKRVHTVHRVKKDSNGSSRPKQQNGRGRERRLGI